MGIRPDDALKCDGCGQTVTGDVATAEQWGMYAWPDGHAFKYTDAPQDAISLCPNCDTAETLTQLVWGDNPPEE